MLLSKQSTTEKNHICQFNNRLIDTILAIDNYSFRLTNYYFYSLSEKRKKTLFFLENRTRLDKVCAHWTERERFLFTSFPSSSQWAKSGNVSRDPECKSCASHSQSKKQRERHFSDFTSSPEREKNNHFSEKKIKKYFLQNLVCGTVTGIRELILHL